jgi:hypothetical protein
VNDVNEQWYSLAEKVGIGVAIYYGVITLLISAVFVTVLVFFWKMMRSMDHNFPRGRR